ncbi:MAG: thiopeptide-type bacteriocin biosynthesis protein [Saprospiraceae bacterium]|nr:thiopeptide-type bacteriocin biosynthesis protein [Saprospiraceae bacterium]MDW8229219.1 thiopeptide-type bacteriocin biosynthesis protein [Saprospiraceae bacterium]
MELRPWLSYHLYPQETLDVFLVRAVRPFLERQVWPQRGARAFFIRYDDDRGPHIRLRLHGEPAWMEAVSQAVSEWFSERGAVEAVAYLPGRDVFRSPEALYWGEEHFHLSSRVVLERMRPPHTYGDALFDALRLHVITAYAAGWSREQASNYFERLCEQWALLFIRPNETSNGTPEQWIKDLRELFENTFRPQQEDIRLAVVELWEALRKGRFDTDQPEWIRWLRGNELILSNLGEALEPALPTLIHLTNNRLGISNADEAYLAYVLYKAL